MKIHTLLALTLSLVFSLNLYSQSQSHGGIGLIGGPATSLYPNDTGTGTTVNQLAKINASGNAVNAGTGDTAVPIFVVVSGAGTSGSAFLAFGGQATCQFDSSGGTVGHFVVASAGTAGRCADAGATAPTSGWVIGQVLTTAAANATGTVSLAPGYNAAAGGGGGSPTAATVSTAVYIATDTGSASVYAGCPTTSVALQDGLIAEFYPANTSTGPSTFNYCASGNKTLAWQDGSGTQSGEILPGKKYFFTYDLASTIWVIPQRQDAAGAGLIRDRTANPPTIAADTSQLCLKTNTCAPSGGQNWAGAATTVPWRSAASDPGTCGPGEAYFNTATNAFKYCGPANTWTTPGGGANFTVPGAGPVYSFNTRWPYIGSNGAFTTASGTIYCFTVPFDTATTLGRMTAYTATGLASSKAIVMGIMDNAATPNILTQGRIVGASGANVTTVTVSQPVGAGQAYNFCLSTEDNGFLPKSLFPGTGADMVMYNLGSDVKVFTCTATATGAAGSYTLPNCGARVTVSSGNFPYIEATQ